MAGKKVKRNKLWERPQTSMVWFRVAPELLKRVDAAVLKLNGCEAVRTGQAAKMTRTGLIVGALQRHLEVASKGEQLELPKVKRG